MATAPEGSARTVREAVGVFHHWENLQAAVDDLLTSGFDRSEVSLLASEAAVEQKLGHAYSKVRELEDDPQAPRTAYVGQDSLTEGRASAVSLLGYVGAVAAVGVVTALGGTLAWTIAAAVAAGGGGAAFGTLVARVLGRTRGESVEAQISKGGLLLWVATKDADHEQRATVILTKHSAEDVHIHDIAASTAPEDDPLSGMMPDPFLPGARL